uniref:Uncharacterized protein n=1 Tax=Cucumis melo TaxID=3656 RepID=A0A9I9DTQ3_CUCME
MSLKLRPTKKRKKGKTAPRLDEDEEDAVGLGKRKRLGWKGRAAHGSDKRDTAHVSTKWLRLQKDVSHGSATLQPHRVDCPREAQPPCEAFPLRPRR